MERRLHIPQVPPSFGQCLQCIQYLHAPQGSLPVQVETDASVILNRPIVNASSGPHPVELAIIVGIAGRMPISAPGSKVEEGRLCHFLHCQRSASLGKVNAPAYQSS